MTLWKTKEDLEKDFEHIRDNIKYRDARIKELEAEVERLKSEHYKHDELTRMREELLKNKEDLYRGFPISKEAEVKIQKFIEKHSDKNRRITGYFRYEFCPTPIGTSGTIIASNGDRLVFQEIE